MKVLLRRNIAAAMYQTMLESKNKILLISQTSRTSGCRKQNFLHAFLSIISIWYWDKMPLTKLLMKYIRQPLQLSMSIGDQVSVPVWNMTMEMTWLLYRCTLKRVMQQSNKLIWALVKKHPKIIDLPFASCMSGSLLYLHCSELLDHRGC